MPKRVVGGEYLLDLSSIEIEKSEDGTKTNITDADVLEQLTNLKKYVSNPNGIKPVWIKLKNGETDELVVARGTFANVDTGEFEICVLLNGYKLIISIEFTQALNEDDEPIDDWYIAENDAKYLFTTDYKRVVVEDVKNIDDNILSTLQCGDVVIKHDESGEHAYVVTFKSDTGICLTYADASGIETQSYDYVDGTGWVYNSEDKWEMTKPIYCHPITLLGANGIHHITMLIFNNIATPFADFDTLITHIRTWGLDTARIMCSGSYKESDSLIVIVSYLAVTDTTIKVVGNYAVNGGSISIDITASTFSAFIDAVNKIN